MIYYAYSSSWSSTDWWSELLLSVMEEFADTAGAYKNCPHPSQPRPMALPPENPAHSPSHCGSLIPNVPKKSHTFSTTQPTYMQTIYGIFPDYLLLLVSVHQYSTVRTVTLKCSQWDHVALERLYCDAQVNTNVVLQVSAHNTRDRKVIKHCTEK